MMGAPTPSCIEQADTVDMWLRAEEEASAARSSRA